MDDIEASKLEASDRINSIVHLLLIWASYVAILSILGSTVLFVSSEISNTVVSAFAATEMDSFFFNCELAGESGGHCYPSPNAVSTYETQGSSKKIYETSTNLADYTDGKYGKALHFKGYLGEYVTLNRSDNFAFRNFSVSFWVKNEPWLNTYAPIIAYINTNSTAGWLFDFNPETKSIRFGITNNSGIVNSPASIPVNTDKFENIIGTFDGSSIKVYKDGLFYASANFTGTYNPDPKVNLRIGLDSFDNENSWAGSIDDLRIFNRSVTKEEVKEIYENSSSVKDLVGHWPFDGRLKDISGNNNNAISRVQTAGMVFAPDGRLFFTVKRTGEVRIMKDEKFFPAPFVTISKTIPRRP